ncbi:MAG: magnesium chelatase subunit D [Myxococcaceae bacterium]|nr:magnesium chelatase subunit D [Myxococcaceae bacterium]
MVALELFGIDPFALQGLLVRCWPGPVRDRVVEALRVVLPAGAPMPKLPAHVTDDRLVGGLSLAGTLRTGTVVVEQGVLPRADGGVVVVPMAERLLPGVVAHLCAALDTASLALEREGLTRVLSCRIGVLALDEGLGDERTPLALAERLPVHLDLSGLPPRLVPPAMPRPEKVTRARALAGTVTIDDALVEALCEAALALGVAGLRASLQAVRVARLHAALEGRSAAAPEDAAVAARLVLGPRATCAPEAPPPAPAPPEPHDEANEPSPPRDDGADAGSEARGAPKDLPELLLAAAEASVPKDLLELGGAPRAPRAGPRSAGRAGASRTSTRGGRPAGARAGVPQGGERLNLVETLRAAAPWQRLRRATRTRDVRRVEVRQSDLRISRMVQKMESCIVFCVDASGSAALQRLAEAKGAVEQVLADCYVRRDHVALVAFRGPSAALLLPPTRSLTRARRCLAELAGGGGTPLAAGIESALTLALDARARGRTPLIVLMTDARANVARVAGTNADDDALACARLVRAQQVSALLLDTSPRPRARARALADAMGATYLPLPRLDAHRVSGQVQQLTREHA